MWLKYLLTFLSIFLFAAILPAEAQNVVEVSPRIINDKTKAREQKQYVVKISNITAARQTLFAVITDISSSKGQIYTREPANLDKDKSAVRWISFDRGQIDILPGQTIEKKLILKISPNAIPGTYYAGVNLIAAPDRYEAEAKIASIDQPDLLMGMEIMDVKVEKAQVIRFRSARSVFLENEAAFYFDIANTGNVDIIPRGEISVYDRQGEEISALAINLDEKAIPGGGKQSFDIKWPTDGKFGKYKARLNASYGGSGQGDLQDTVFFWIVPSRLLILFSSGIIALVALLTVIIFKISYRRYPEIAPAFAGKDAGGESDIGNSLIPEKVAPVPVADNEEENISA